jgi:hypothetical protein
MTATLTEPRVVYDMPDAEYRAVPALSYSGAKGLLPPRSPAHYRYEQTHPRPPKRAYDLGHAAHRRVLGAGAELVTVEGTYGPKSKRAGEAWSDYIDPKAQDARDAIYDSGRVPLLPRELEEIEAMAGAVFAHPLAGRLYTGGHAEVSLFWTDEATGVPMKARLDYLATRPGLMIAVDLKTTPGAHPVQLPKTVADFSYQIQNAVYLDGMAACGLGPAGFLFVFVEKEPPHAVSVGQLTEQDIDIGRQLAGRAAEIYRDCTASGIWPAYDPGITTINLPPWSRRRNEETIYVDN